MPLVRFVMPLLLAVFVAIGLMPMRATRAADSYALACNPPGSLSYTLAAALASAAGDNPTLRPQPYGGSNQILPLIGSGEVAFGMATAMEVDMATKGEGDFAGRPVENLTAVANLFPFRVGFLVRSDSPIRTLADLKGKRIPNFSGHGATEATVRALLANAGLTPSDVDYVPVGNFMQQFDATNADHVDAWMASAGLPALVDLAQHVGGLRYLAIDVSPAAIEAMQKVLPLVYPVEVKPLPNIIGLDGPTKLMAYDYLLLANASVSDEVVASVARILHTQGDRLIANAPAFKAMRPEHLAKPTPIAYHHGAEHYYHVNGLSLAP